MNGAAQPAIDLALPPNPAPASVSAEREEFRELKGRFLACLNHEIRTPLTGILGMMELLEETGLSGLQQEYAAIARTCAQQLYEVLSDTLEFAALTAREIRPVSAPFALRAALQATAHAFEARAAAEGLVFELDLSPAIPEIARGDEIRLRRLLEQLLSNAIKFTPQGRISLRIRTAPWGPNLSRLDLHVTDTGIGIPAEKLASIFESFEQVEGGLSRGYQGLGLGLALAKEMVELLGGQIQVHSEVGKGSTFHAWLPLESATPELASPVPAPSPATGPRRVLLVEDNRVSQRIVTHMLDRAGFQAEIASSGPAALRAVSSVRYDLILMDLQMPGMDGIETTLRIRKVPGYERTPVVALTANSSPEFQELCYQNGLQAFLSKPIHSRELLETVRRFTAASI
jgi:CheY-like chemotaxis protein